MIMWVTKLAQSSELTGCLLEPRVSFVTADCSHTSSLALKKKPDKEEDSVLPQALWSQGLWRCSAVRSRTADIHADHVHAVCQDPVLLPSSLSHCLSANRVSSGVTSVRAYFSPSDGVGGRERSSPDSVAPAAIGGPTSLDSLTFDLSPVPS